MNSLICSGQNFKYLKIDFECDAVVDIEPDSRVLLKNLMKKENDYSKIKLNLLSSNKLNLKNKNNSINCKFSGFDEKGIKIADKKCWGKIVDFF